MTRLERGLVELQEALADLEARWALVGGLAVSVRTAPRMTRDVDVAVAVRDDAEAVAFVGALRARGYRLLDQIDQEATGRLAMVELASPGPEEESIRVDLLFAFSGIEPEIARDGEELRVFRATTLRVARVPHLIALKTLSASPERGQDRLDLHNLLREASPSEIQTARDLLDLVESRGCHRKKDLRAELEQELALIRPDRRKT